MYVAELEPLEKPTMQERVVLSVVLLVFSALALFGLIIKSSEPVLEKMWVLLGVLISLAASLAMIALALGSNIPKKQGPASEMILS